jgi:hypothetical protein
VSEIFTETPATALAPGQAAYEAWQRVRFPDNPVPWGHPALGSKTRNAWDAAAKAAIDAAGPGFTALETECGKLGDVLRRLADPDVWVLDAGLGGGYEEDRHVRASLAAQALGLDVCGCTECMVSLGIEPEDT